MTASSTVPRMRATELLWTLYGEHKGYVVILFLAYCTSDAGISILIPLFSRVRQASHRNRFRRFRAAFDFPHSAT